MKYNNIIVVSAVNIVEGGALSILKECVKELNDYVQNNELKIKVLVNSSKVLPKYDNVECISFSLSKKNFVFRLFYEYLYFYFLSLKLKPLIWLSLHDMTPIVFAKKQFVYMHNPSPFFKNEKKISLSVKFRIFTKLYKYLYKFNVKNNSALIVQQEWFRNEISKLCKIKKEKIIVAYPEATKLDVDDCLSVGYKKSQFFFNSFPREFKNFEVICKAANILNERDCITEDWNVFLTIDGSENLYSRKIVEKYKENTHIHFIGLITREECEKYYRESECLIFPSVLETWGLPISEFKLYKKKMILADLPYAFEAANGAESVCFFNPYDDCLLADIMESVIKGKEGRFEKLKIIEKQVPFCETWKSLFDRIIANI